MSSAPGKILPMVPSTKIVFLGNGGSFKVPQGGFDGYYFNLHTDKKDWGFGKKLLARNPEMYFAAHRDSEVVAMNRHTSSNKITRNLNTEDKQEKTMSTQEETADHYNAKNLTAAEFSKFSIAIRILKSIGIKPTAFENVNTQDSETLLQNISIQSELQELSDAVKHTDLPDQGEHSIHFEKRVGDTLMDVRFNVKQS